MTQGHCPSCGAELEFKLGSSVVVICAHCHSIVARTDRNLKEIGKIAALAESESPLSAGINGKYRGAAFQITGGAQLKHHLGGTWNEWYAAFGDGRWGWIAEAQGRFYVTFRAPLDQHAVPAYSDIHIGHRVQNVPGIWTASEKGTAVYLSAQGEIPFLLTPGVSYPYADLNGDAGKFGTLDFSENPPLFFTGVQVELKDLGVDLRAAAPAKQVKTAAVACPHCGGPLELKAPDKTERVACPYCSALLDCTQGNLTFLKTLAVSRKPLIKLGSAGEFDGVKFTVIGFVIRSCVVDRIRYYWEEYLLYNPAAGYRWLVHSDHHWTFVTTVHPGLIREGIRVTSYGGQQFKRFQDADGRVEHVLGEFYWKVEVGETVAMSDFVAPPLMISKEVNPAAEINWSVGRYVPREEIKKIFALQSLPFATGVGPCQPFPYNDLYRPALAALCVAVVMALIFVGAAPTREILRGQFTFRPAATAEGTQTVFSEPFQLDARRNIEIQASAPVNNSWVYLEGDIVDDKSGLVQPFDLPIEYYYGNDGGESWTEGSTTSSTTISALPSGAYVLRLEAQWQYSTQPVTASVVVRQGVAPWTNTIVAIVLLSILPIALIVWQASFESRRWAGSMYGPKSSSGDDD